MKIQFATFCRDWSVPLAGLICLFCELRFLNHLGKRPAQKNGKSFNLNKLTKTDKRLDKLKKGGKYYELGKINNFCEFPRLAHYR